jgi:hypothetical protein
MKNSSGIFQNRAHAPHQMKQGFLAFVLSSVFLLAIVAAALQLSSAAQDNSYQKYRHMQLQELAVKKAFYDSTADAASKALIDARLKNAACRAATGSDCVHEKDFVEDAVFANVPNMEGDLKNNGKSGRLLLARQLGFLFVA